MESNPLRIQLRRTKGWRIPAGTVKVCRPGKWENPFTVGRYGSRLALDNYRRRLDGMEAIDALDLSELAGKNLACWCKLCPEHAGGKPAGVVCARCEPCHADILLERAARAAKERER